MDGAQVIPQKPRQMHAFLVAQFRWERYRFSRLILVHLLAVTALLVWLPIPAWLHTPVATACTTCFLGALFAGMMEWHWSRERDRRAGALSDHGDLVGHPRR